MNRASTFGASSGLAQKQRQIKALHDRLATLQANTNNLQLAIQISAEQASQIRQLGANFGSLFMAVQRVMAPGSDENEEAPNTISPEPQAQTP